MGFQLWQGDQHIVVGDMLGQFQVLEEGVAVVVVGLRLVEFRYGCVSEDCGQSRGFCDGGRGSDSRSVAKGNRCWLCVFASLDDCSDNRWMRSDRPFGNGRRNQVRLKQYTLSRLHEMTDAAPGGQQAGQGFGNGVGIVVGIEFDNADDRLFCHILGHVNVPCLPSFVVFQRCRLAFSGYRE